MVEYFVKVVVFGKKNGCIRANWLYTGKSGCIPARWLFSRKTCCIWAKVVVLVIYSFNRAKEVVLWQKWLYSGKVVVFRQVVVFEKKRLCSGKNGFI